MADEMATGRGWWYAVEFRSTEALMALRHFCTEHNIPLTIEKERSSVQVKRGLFFRSTESHPMLHINWVAGPGPKHLIEAIEKWVKAFEFEVRV